MRLRLPLAERLRPSELQTTLFWAGVVGFLGAGAAALFRGLALAVQELLWGQSGDLVHSAEAFPAWLRIVVPVAGGLAAGLVIQLGGRFARGQPSTDYMEAVVLGEGTIRVRPSLVKSTSSLFSIASGGSIGREGAMVQLSGMLASWLGRRRRFSLPRRKLIVACGAAAGIASAYNSPLTGAFFVAEIMLGSIAMESLGPLVFASVVATVTTREILGGGPIFLVHSFQLVSPWELLPYLALGVLLGLAAPWFIRLLRASERLFAATNLPVFARLGLGGLVVGLLSTVVPEVWGNGSASVTSFLQDGWEWKALLLVLVAKLLATAATVGSGAVGGVFTPTLFTGASVGYAVGLGVNALWDEGTAGPSAYALVGMGAFLAGTTQAPLMAMLIVFEMTLDYGTILPLMLCCVAAHFTATGSGSPSIYTHVMERKRAAAGPERILGRTVGELVRKNPPIIPERATFAELVEVFQGHRHNYVYVTSETGRLLGAVSLHDIKAHMGDEAIARILIASELLHDDMPTVSENDTLTQALDRFLSFDGERLPVISDAAERRLVGYLAKTDLLLTLADRKAEPSPPLGEGSA
jgi:CIC family chloride channel protein